LITPFPEHSVIDIPTARENTKDEYRIATHQKSDTDVVTVTDDPQTLHPAFSLRTSFWKCVQRFNKPQNSIDEIAGNATAGFGRDIGV